MDWGSLGSWSLRWPVALAVVSLVALAAAALAWASARRRCGKGENGNAGKEWPTIWHWRSLVGAGKGETGKGETGKGKTGKGETAENRMARPSSHGGEQASSLWRVYRTLAKAALALVVALAALAALLAARPSTVDRAQTASSSRDIVLCLDVSGSTLPYDREVIATYLDLVGNFKGERIGLSIFNSTSRTVFPLTDDYDLVTAQLTAALDVLKGVQTQDDIDHMTDKDYQNVADWLEGTQNRKDSTSLIGDGVVSCASMLPGFSVSAQSSQAAAQSRTRPASIVLATDNVLSGTPLYSLDEALSLAQSSGITVDGLYSGAAQTSADQEATAMRTAIESHGGTYFDMTSGDSVALIVRSIESNAARERERSGRSDRVDAPGLALAAFAVVFVAYLLVVGRLGR